MKSDAVGNVVLANALELLRICSQTESHTIHPSEAAVVLEHIRAIQADRNEWRARAARLTGPG